MQIGNNNWKVIVATDMKKATQAIKENNKATGNKTGIVAFFNHGGENMMEFSYGSGGLQNTSTLGAAQVNIFLHKGSGNINSSETNEF